MKTKEDLILEKLEKLEKLIKTNTHAHSNEKYFTDLMSKACQVLIVDKLIGDLINTKYASLFKYLFDYGNGSFDSKNAILDWITGTGIATKVFLVLFLNTKGASLVSKYIATPFYENIYEPITQKACDAYDNWSHETYDSAIEHIGETVAIDTVYNQ